MIKFVSICLLMFGLTACPGNPPNDSDKKQRDQQEVLLGEATAEVGMPAIKNWRERRLLKTILELRDQAITTYTYLVGDDDAKLVFFCTSVGYGLPYALQFTSPEKPMWDRGDHNGGNITLPQADPNALFSPGAAEGTWVMCLDPNGQDTKPVYVEPRIVVSPFPMPADVPSAPVEK